MEDKGLVRAMIIGDWCTILGNKLNSFYETLSCRGYRKLYPLSPLISFPNKCPIRANKNAFPTNFYYLSFNLPIQFWLIFIAFTCLARLKNAAGKYFSLANHRDVRRTDGQKPGGRMKKCAGAHMKRATFSYVRFLLSFLAMIWIPF
jgi:hypothetical protein